jgi:hypothetical protein
MTKHLLLSLLAVINTSLMAGEPVHFSDYRLKKAVEERLGFSDPAAVDMLRLTELKMDCVDSLTGLENARNLKILRIHRNNQRTALDIAPLSSLTNLRTLALTFCKIEDISALSSLVNLRYLSLGGNNFSDLSALSSLENLENLSLGSNRISDISHIAHLVKLKKLVLGGSRIQDITPVSSLANLTHLSLGSNRIIDISPLSSLTNLTHLSLGWNRIIDVSPLSSLTNLTYLSLPSNRITDVSALSSLTNLTKLGLSDNQIKDISALSSLENLTTLSLRFNFVSDASALSDLPKLQDVNIKNNPFCLRQFLPVAYTALAVFSIASLATYLYLKKTARGKRKTRLLTIVSWACCIYAPLICWFCLDLMRDVLSKQTMSKINNNQFLSVVIIISPSVALLTAGMWASVNALRNTWRGNVLRLSRAATAITLVAMSASTVLCGLRILVFILVSYTIHPYYSRMFYM